MSLDRFKNLVILIVIIIGLVSGLMLGFQLGNNGGDTTDADNFSLKVLEKQDPETFLVVGVNNIHQTPAKLESLWLAEANIDEFRVSLYPIYPSIESNSIQTAHEPIMVSPAGPAEVFELGFLEPDEVDHLIILDKAAFWTLVQLSDQSVELPIDHNKGTEFDAFPHAWQDPGLAYDYQVSILNYLCKHSMPFSQEDRVQELVKLVNNYLFTDISLEQLLSYWQKLFENDFIFTCEFK